MTVQVDSSKVGATPLFQQAGTGAIVRTLRAKSLEAAVSPEDFGALGDGSTNDTAALILASACCRDSGRELHLTSGKVYVVNGRFTLQDLNGVTLDGNQATIRQTGNHHTLVAIPGESGVSDFTTEAVLPMTGDPARGDKSVTLTTAAHAGNFAAGDYIWVRSRQTITPNVGETARQPVAELNVVTAADAGTGVVSLKYPLAKDYVKDTSNNDPATGTLFLHGVVVATGGAAVVGENVTLRNLIIEDTSSTGKWALFLRQVFGLTMVGCTVRAQNALVIRGRFLRILRNNFELASNTSSTYYGDYGIAPDTGTSDCWIEDNYINNVNGFAYIHLHEGLANMSVRRNILMSAKTKTHDAGPYGCINLAGSSWNVSVGGNTIVNAPVQTATYAMGGIRASGSWVADQGHVGLVISDNTLVGHFGYYPIDVGDANGTAKAQVCGNKFHCTSDQSVYLRVTTADALVADNDVPYDKVSVTGARPTIRQRGLPNTIADYAHNSPEGATLAQRTTATDSPRLLWENTADSRGVTARMGTAGQWLLATNATPGSTSGTTTMQLRRATTLAAGGTAADLLMNIDGVETLKQVLVLDDDTGTAGYRLLVVAN